MRCSHECGRPEKTVRLSRLSGRSNEGSQSRNRRISVQHQLNGSSVRHFPWSRSGEGMRSDSSTFTFSGRPAGRFYDVWCLPVTVMGPPDRRESDCRADDGCFGDLSAGIGIANALGFPCVNP